MRAGYRLTIAALAALALAGCATSPSGRVSAPVTMDTPEALRARGVQRFLFDGWRGPSLPVWYFRPASADRDAPVLFVHHGVRRDADRYIAEWLDLAAAEGIVLIVPEFTRAAFPGARAYSHGNLFDAEGRPNPREIWSFSVIEPIFDAVVARENLTTREYLMYGHSGGAQFVHRYVLAGGGLRLARAVSANAGSYAFTDASVAWPFGLGDLPAGLWQPAKAFGQELVVLLGTADNDPKHPSLPDQPRAVAQGPHRLGRGKAFFARARAEAVERGAPFRWRCALVPGVGHDNAGMAPFALSLFRGEKLSRKSCEQ